MPLISDRYNNYNNQQNSEQMKRSMPMIEPHSLYEKYIQDNGWRLNNNKYIFNNSQSSEVYYNLMEENKKQSNYIMRLEQKINKLENVSNLFLDLLRDDYPLNNIIMNNNYLNNNLFDGCFPYLSFDSKGRKSLLYLNREAINNHKIKDKNKKYDYLVPILPKYNSAAQNNRAAFLLNNEKLKYFSKGPKSKPFFVYKDAINIMNMCQKINSAQYFNQKFDFKNYNSNSKINSEINSDKNSKENKSNSSKINLKTRLSELENLQKKQKKDIDYLMGKLKLNKDENVSKNKNTDKNSVKKDNIKNNQENKKEDKKENKESEDSDEEDDDEEEEEEEDDEDCSDSENKDEKEVTIKSFKSD